VGDFGKGALAVCAARHCSTENWPLLVALLAVVAGHVWPVQLRFRGGKGMATSLGALLVYDYQLALVYALAFAAAFAALRKTVLPGLLALALLPLMSWHLKRDPTEAVGTSLLAALVLMAHRTNLMTEISRVLDRRNLSPKHSPPE
jgi:glycerol-3-phosphate acyltransferase PlsY